MALKQKPEKRIVIISHAEEAHAAHIYNALQARGAPACFLDIRQFPGAVKIAYSPSGHHQAMLTIHSRPILPESVYWRWYHSPKISPGLSPSDASVQFRNAEAAIKGLFHALKCMWVNPPDSYYLHWCKPKQLALFHKAKVPVPKTLITNDMHALFKFAEAHPQKVIYKPVQGGCATQLVDSGESLSQLETLLASQPLTIQEYIKGDDIRVYIVGHQLYALKITAGTVDFRNDSAHTIDPIDIPEAIKAYCYKIAKLSQYVFTAIDIKRDAAGDYYFLEANPSPMFLHVEKVTGIPITRNLVDLLISSKA